MPDALAWLGDWSPYTIFLLTGLRIYTGEYKAQARPKGGHYEGRGLWIRRYRYASQLVRSVLPD